MITKNYIYALLAAFLMPFTIVAMEHQQIVPGTHNTYQGKQITAENLYELSTKPSEPLQMALTSWFSNPDNRKKIDGLNHFPICKTIKDVSVAHNLKQGLIIELFKDTNLSKHNYIFHPEGEPFAVRIAGIPNTLRATLSKLKLNPWPSSWEGYDFEKITSSTDSLYQHTSCQAHYLRLQELKPYLRYVNIVPTYLQPLTETPAKPCCDSNYVVVQELFDNKKIKELRTLPAEQQKEIISNLPERAIKELFFVTKYAALWDISNNLMVNLDNPQELWVADYEQPNNSNAEHFFYKHQAGYDKYYSDVRNGLGYLRDLLQTNAPKHYELWLAIDKQDWNTFVEDMKK